VGDLPIVVSAPHGGAIEPPGIPTRTSGATATDLNTIDLARAIADALRARTGRAPHLVICHLRRTKLDANRDVGEAAEGQPSMIAAWGEYHDFIEQAIGEVQRAGGRGFYLDLHGHGHPIQRLELGYLLSAAEFDRTDAELDAGAVGSMSSLRLALGWSPDGFAEVLRGATSLGGLLAPSYPAVPSPSAPAPGADPYFTGGYSTERHTARLPGLQIEANFTGVRDSAASRTAFASALAEAVLAFIERHIGAR
jgi:hypothetical protein